MKNNKNLIHSLLVIAAGMAFSACVDDSYDMSKDIDMTMGFGSKELQLNVGNSEKIWLSDILEVDKDVWEKEAAEIEEHYKKFGDRLPKELREQLNNLKANLK